MPPANLLRLTALASLGLAAFPPAGSKKFMAFYLAWAGFYILFGSEPKLLGT